MVFSKRLQDKEELERRSQGRYPISKDLVIAYQSGIVLSRKGFGEARDLSIGGIRFAALHKIKKGAQMKLKIHFPKGFPGEKFVEAEAEVVRTDERRQQISCRFLDPSLRVTESIQQFLWWLELAA